MLRFVADEDFTRLIVRGVLRIRPDVDIVRVQDVGLRTQEDAVVLDWAAREGRVLLTHDAQTMPAHAYERVRNMLPMPGVFVTPQDVAIGQRKPETVFRQPQKDRVIQDAAIGIGDQDVFALPDR